MSISAFTQRSLRLAATCVPVFMAVGATVAALVVITEFQTKPADYAALTPDQFNGIEFVALAERPTVPGLEDAITRTCAETGCDGDTLHPMILASAERMTRDELTVALAAQSRIQTESRATRARSLPGTDGALLAEMEILAADRIAALYGMELDQR